MKRPITYDDLRQLPEGAGYEVIGGALVHEPAPSIAHQLVVKRVVIALDAFAAPRGSGLVIPSPVDVRLAESEVYHPDVVFVSAERRAIVGEASIEGAPDLVVEVLSVSSAYNDLRRKRDVYERGGVREYWIVDPMRRTVEVLESVGASFVLRRERADGVVSSRVLAGFEIDVDEIFRFD